MPQKIVRGSKHQQFSAAAAAMGAFWDRARAREERRIELLRRALIASGESASGTLVIPRTAAAD
jgi:hypothetical protein